MLLAQNDSLLRNKYSFSYPKYTVFAFYDAIRFAGIGAEYRPLGSFSIDVKAGLVYANGLALKVSEKIKPVFTDYAYNKGVGIMLSPKYHFGNKKAYYFGLYAALYEYGYSNKMISPIYTVYENYINGTYMGVSTQTIYQGAKNSTSFAFGSTIGFSKNIQRMIFEVFMAAGVERAYGNTTTYITQTNPNTPTYTTSFSDVQYSAIFNALAGVKIGLGFKQKQLTSVKYYTSMLKSLLKEEDLFVEQLIPSDSLSEEDIKGYYLFKQKVFKNLKNEYQPETTSNAQMNQLTEHAYQEIKNYVAYSFKK